ncbi:reprolysin-like metallopeptidase [Dyella sp. GSA-30]|uniref:reprolysin-like metallopeptidase n=1 Tax=Dyella sp. GSA-30 TaxID=2994496 RepID=UPI002490AB2A|nr:M12 family metallo-peptidase [Dyella sp. GSA-30]BDU18589.1 peptidyl-Asp metalloendopeptidase [Dyella sp. GSA-30]
MNRRILPCVLSVLLGVPCLAMAAAPSLLSPQPAMMLATSADISLAGISQNPANTVLSQVRANTAELFAETPAISLSLEPGVELTFDLAEAESFADGSLVWQGKLNAGASWSDAPAGTDDYALLVRNGSMLTGDIRHGGKVYEIRPLHSGGHVLYLQDPSMLPMHDEDDLRLMESSLPADQGAPAPRVAAEAVADVLILFAQRAAAQYRDQLGLARMLIAQMNMGFKNSEIEGGVRLANDTPFTISYTESGNQGTDLNRLSNARDGWIDFVHQMRDNYKADLVTLLIHDPIGASRSCGVAWINATREQAFSVTQASCTGNYTFTHEIGHNYGAAHERAQGAGPYTYGHGYRHPRGDWGTVMAYPCNFGRRCPPLLRWSSPLLTYQGAVTGTARTEDNRRVVNQRKEVMAGYR